MSGTREISEQKANALNFFNPVLSTNQRPRFWALNQWEASISGPLILTHFQYHTALLAIRLQSQQSDCNLSNPCAISTIRVQSQQSDCNPPALQSDCGDCSLFVEIASLIVKIAVKSWRLQSNYADCCLIVKIAVWLWRLPSGMSGMREISERKANALNFLNPVLSTNQRPRFWALNQWEASLQFLRFWLTYKIKLQSQQSDSHLSNQTAISAIRLQSQQSDCNPPALQSDCVDCSSIVEIAVWL